MGYKILISANHLTIYVQIFEGRNFHGCTVPWIYAKFSSSKLLLELALIDKLKRSSKIKPQKS